MSNKKVVIVSATHLIPTILKDVKFVLGEDISYSCFDIDNCDNETIVGDVILVTHPAAAPKLRRLLKTNTPIIRVRRTFFEKDIAPLLKMPMGTRILVVNDSEHMSEEAAARLSNLNLPNITFYPMTSRIDASQFRIALTPGETKYVPDTVQRTIDIGNRHLAVSTMLDIIAYLHLKSDQYASRLINYSALTIDDDIGLKEEYRNAAVFNGQAANLLEHIGQGALVVGENRKILYKNKRLEELLELSPDNTGTSFDDLFDAETAEHLWKLTNEKNTFAFRVQDKEILAEFDVETIFGEKQRFYCFSDVTYMRYLENSLKSRAITSGFVAKRSFDDIIFASPQMKQCIEMLRIFAASEKTVLIQGESGTGKELLAQSIHNASARKSAPFVAINCAALPESLLESELFGYEKGAFTGASQNGKTGLFERAQHGTLFLDEIGDMPISLQVRLLRVLQEREILRVGGTRVIPINVRIIAATNQDLLEKAKKGEFRTDLYYRLNVLPVTVPPLRERREDILPLFLHFIGQKHVPDAVARFLIEYAWPGNVRELQNVAEYYTMMKNSSRPLPDFLGHESKSCETPNTETAILDILRKDGFIGRKRLCERINVSEYTLRKTLKSMEEKGLIVIHRGRKGIEKATDERLWQK